MFVVENDIEFGKDTHSAQDKRSSFFFRKEALYLKGEGTWPIIIWRV